MSLTVPSRVPVNLTGHSMVAAQVAAQAAALEQLREKLESGEPPEKKLALGSEEQQRLVQRAIQQNLLAMTTQFPMNIRINSQGNSASKILSEIAGPCKTCLNYLLADETYGN